MAQAIVGSSCLIYEAALASADRSNLSSFLAVACAIHPNLTPNEVGCIFPELKEPSVVGELALFLRASKIIHSKKDTLQHRAFV
jgi:hypothetical protein